MNVPLIRHCNLYKTNYHSLLFHKSNPCMPMNVNHAKKHVVKAFNGDEGGERRGFLSLEEAGLVEISGLNTHERFLCRLTISSLNLLKVIAEQEGCTIEELNAGKVCDWFLKDKLKREQNIGTPVLQWDDDDPFEDFI
ncbi:uncharacterized protein LOC141593993 [Silene latifolia]|uniref:uncharacterized protein LOC141593993 n=1 Tax=Silene latifolia TaxID=37657 RepID=UPI003D77716E